MFKKLQILLVLVNLLWSAQTFAQHVVYIQNNTALDYNFQVIQEGNLTLNTNQYSVMSSLLTAYQNGMAMMEFEPDTVLSPGDTVVFNGLLTSGPDTVILQMMVAADNTGSEAYFSGAANTFDLEWYDDLNFHSEAFSMQGDPFTFKFKAATDIIDFDKDVGYAIQADFVYAIDSTDISDPNIINVMSYNIQMTPIVSSNFFERATYWPAHISPYQDVVVIQEIFEDDTRINDLTPALVAAGFPYYTLVLNDTALPNITSPTNGGVLIYSRWPIEDEAEIKYANCSNNGAFDCLASKGVKYAKINKLGKLYHIFGTHMEAGGSAADVQYRLEQYGEIANFMDTLNIPETEPVIFCGDFNTGPKDGLEYDSLLRNTNPIIPTHIGYYESTFSYADTGKIIDHVWGQADHLHPIESYNSIITFRSVDSVMWNIYDFSDHRTCIGRFVYPDLQPDSFGDTSLCALLPLTLNVSTSDALSYIWTLNGTIIPGANSGSYLISNPSLSTTGVYACEVTDTTVYGYQNDVLTQWFFPDGPDTLVQTITYTLANIGFESPCVSSIKVRRQKAASIYPVPNNGHFEVRLKSRIGDEILELYDSKGRLISKKANLGPSTNYNISDLPTGMYLLRIVGSTINQANKILVY